MIRSLRETAMMTRKNLFPICALVASLALISMMFTGCTTEPEPAPAPAEEAKEPAEAPPPPEPEPAKEPEEPKPAAAKKPPSKKALMNPSALKEQAPENYRVQFDTSKGDIIIEVTRSWAPKGADRFYNLAANGFFDGCRFFRVVPNFIVQFGLGPDPAVNRMWEQARITDDPVTKTNRRGSVTFATAGPNTRTTQLFINFKANAFLDNQGFAPFGRVVEGMDVVDSLNAEYGEAPDQSMIRNQGQKYLDGKFPNLDYIEAATILP